MSAIASASGVAAGNQHEQEYADFLARVQSRFMSNLMVNGQMRPLFMTDVAPGVIWDVYLSCFSGQEQQFHNCNSCRRFIERYAGLVTIDESGCQRSAIFDLRDATPEYEGVFRKLISRAERANVAGVFQWDTGVLGEPKTGNWIHLGLRIPKPDRHSLRNADQRTAQFTEDFGMLTRALDDYGMVIAAEAVRVLESDSMFRAEKVIEPARWFNALHVSLEGKRAPKVRRNLIWRAVATAPTGFCHVRSSMIGTLLDDLGQGMSFTEVQTRFRSKMNPLQYQRPQAAPRAGNIQQAEKIFEELGLAASLQRRIARLEEVPMVWQPYRERKAVPSGTGVFGDVQPRQSGPAPASNGVNLPRQDMSLRKFREKVIPTAEKIEVYLQSNAHFITITTAVNPEAPPVFQWNHPFAWYVWAGAPTPAHFSLLPYTWTEVAGITRLPARYDDEGDRLKHQGDGVILLLKGARETRSAGAALFPELLRADLREVRATIEAKSRAMRMQGLEDGTAIGVDLRMTGGEPGRGHYPVDVRVTSAGKTSLYRIDRWD